MQRFRSLAAPAVAALLATTAFAGNGAPEPGSLLIFPLFQHTAGSVTAITVTNTNPDMTELGNQLTGTVDVEYNYLNGDALGGFFYCQKSDTTKRLTPNDTITVSSSVDNPSFARGWLYVFAKSPTTGQAISWNWLAGKATVITSGPDAYSYNPYVYKAGRIAQGGPTDLNANGLRDFNGAEYERVVDRILVPHFFGVTATRPVELVLVNLTGSGGFYATVDFLAYNDNENQFSANYIFRCWARVNLQDISGMFSNMFLEDSSDTNELFNGARSGWYRLNGGVAFSSADQVSDPAILALQIGSWRGTARTDLWADLPFTQGINPTHGEVLSQNILHD